MSALLHDLLAFLLTFAVHGTVAVLLAGLATWPRRWRGRTGPWRFALLGGLLSAGLQTVLAPALHFDLGWLLPATSTTASVDLPEPELAVVASGLAPVVPAAIAGERAPTVPVLPLALAAAALALACLGTTRLLQAQARLRAILGRRVPEPEPRILAMAASVAAAAGLRQTPRLSRCADLASPVAFGVSSPEICLPARACELADDELRAMLAHELAHLVHRDSLWLWLGAVLQALFPWHLPLRWARRRLHHAIELRCDARAAQASSGEAVANCLLQVAGWLRGPGRVPAGALAMAARPSALRQRVLAALAADGTVQRSRPLRALLLALLATGFLVAAVPGAGDAPLGPVTGAVAEAAGAASAPASIGLDALLAEEAALVAEAQALRRELGPQSGVPSTARLLQQLEQRLQRLRAARARLVALSATVRDGTAPARR